MVTNQAKADLQAEHFSGKMTTKTQMTQCLRLIPLCNTRLDSLMVQENTVKRLPRNINTRKALGPDEMSPFLLKRCTREL